MEVELPEPEDPEDPGHEVLVVRGRHGAVLGARGGEARLAQVDRRRGPTAEDLLPEPGYVLGEHLAPSVLEEPRGPVLGEPLRDLLQDELGLRVVVRGLRELALGVAHLGEGEELEER